MASESSVLVRLRLLGGQAFAREARAAGSGLGAIGGKGSVAQRGLSKVNKVVGASAVALRGIGIAAGTAAATGIAFAVSKSVTFEQSMANVQARLLTTKGNMTLLSNQALDLGAKTQFSAQQAADAMNEFAAAGFDTRQIMSLMPGTLNLAAASGQDLATTAELQGAMMRQFGLHASDANHVADLLTVAVNKSAIGMDDLGLTMKYVGPVAGRFHQSIEDIAASAALLGNVGIKGETAGTTLRRAFVSIIRPSKRTVDVLDSMGISATDLSKSTQDAKGNLRPFPQILGNLSDQMRGLSKGDRRRAIAQLFGTEALPGMLTLLGKGRKRIEAMSGSLLHSGGAAKRTAGIMRNTVAGAWDNFTGSVETAAITLTQGFMPSLRNTLNRAGGLVDRAAPKMRAFFGGLGGQAPKQPRGPRTPGGARADAGPAQLTGAAASGADLRSKLQPVMAWLGAQAPKVGQALLGAGRDLLNAFKPAAPFFSNVLLPLLKGLAVGVLGGVVFAFKLAIPIIKVVMTALGFVGRVLAPLKPLFFGIGVVIGAIAGGPILGFLGRIKYLGVVFRILALPIRFVAQQLKNLTAIVKLVGGGFLRALTGAQRFAGTFTSLPGRLVRAALNMVGGIVHTIETLPGRLVSLARSAASRLVSGLSGGVRSRLGSLAAFMGRVGKTMLDAVVNAIKAAPGAIFEAIKSLLPGGKIGGKIMDALGLQSGGTVRRGGWAVVGERGPELARLPGGSTVYDSRQTTRARAAMAASPPIVATAHLNLDGKQIHSTVFRIDQRMQEAT